MSAALDGVRLKIGRAEAHIRELEREIHAYVESRPYEVLRQAQGASQIIPIHIRVPPPPHLSCIVGDVVYNSRAALELVFWALALETGPKDPDRDRISFPIFADQSKFAGAQDGFERYLPAGGDRRHRRRAAVPNAQRVAVGPQNAVESRQAWIPHLGRDWRTRP